MPLEMRFTKSHEWVAFSGEELSVGITSYASEALGTMVHLEYTVADDASVNSGDAVLVVESAKSASDVYSPIDGTIVALNTALEDAPESVEGAENGEIWMFKMQPSNPLDVASLMTSEEYEEYLKSL